MRLYKMNLLSKTKPRNLDFEKNYWPDFFQSHVAIRKIKTQMKTYQRGDPANAKNEAPRKLNEKKE